MKVFTKEAIKAMERITMPCDVRIEVLPGFRKRGIRGLLFRQEGVRLAISLIDPRNEAVIKKFDDLADTHYHPHDVVRLYKLFCKFEVISPSTKK